MAGITDSFGAGGSGCLGMKLNLDGTSPGRRPMEEVTMIMPTPSSRLQMEAISWRFILNPLVQGSGDVWVLKLDTGGNITWQKTYGG